MGRWNNRPQWVRAIEMQAAILLAAALAGFLFSLIPSHSSHNVAASRTGHSASSNACREDKAGVLGQLKSDHYDPQYCGPNNAGLITGWWVRKGWPTVVARQHSKGAPITLDGFYSEPRPGTSANDLLSIIPGQRGVTVATFVNAAKALLAETGRLRKLPAKPDCVDWSRTRQVSVKIDGRTVRFLFRYWVFTGGRIVRPAVCPLA